MELASRGEERDLVMSIYLETKKMVLVNLVTDEALRKGWSSSQPG